MEYSLLKGIILGTFVFIIFGEKSIQAGLIITTIVLILKITNATIDKFFPKNEEKEKR